MPRPRKGAPLFFVDRCHDPPSGARCGRRRQSAGGTVRPTAPGRYLWSSLSGDGSGSYVRSRFCILVSFTFSFTNVTRRIYGLTVHQAYRYYRLYPNDPPVLKLLASHVY